MTIAIQAEDVRLRGHGGDLIEGYFARPLGDGPYGNVVVIHHAPGYDDSTREMVRTFAVNGYNALCPDLYFREGPGSTDDVAAIVRAAGGAPDDRVVGDVEGAADYLRALMTSNGKVGVIGHCSGGRQVYICAAKIPSLNAGVDCYGGRVVQDQFTERQPVSPLSMTADISFPILGLFGAEDRNPDPAQVAVIDAEMSKHGKEHEFHSYEGAGHAFFTVDRPAYRVEAAVDGWSKIFDFYGRHLS